MEVELKMSMRNKVINVSYNQK